MVWIWFAKEWVAKNIQSFATVPKRRTDWRALGPLLNYHLPLYPSTILQTFFLFNFKFWNFMEPNFEVPYPFLSSGSSSNFHFFELSNIWICNFLGHSWITTPLSLFGPLFNFSILGFLIFLVRSRSTICLSHSLNSSIFPFWIPKNNKSSIFYTSWTAPWWANSLFLASSEQMSRKSRVLLSQMSSSFHLNGLSAHIVGNSVINYDIYWVSKK